MTEPTLNRPLTKAQLRVMRILAESPNHTSAPISIERRAEGHGWRKFYVLTRTLRMLVAKGMIENHKDNLYRLTARGREEATLHFKNFRMPMTREEADGLLEFMENPSYPTRPPRTLPMREG